MAYFKIIVPQKDKYLDMGMVRIFATFYLEEGDEGFDKYKAEHYVQIPVIPEGGYPRQEEFREAEKAWVPILMPIMESEVELAEEHQEEWLLKYPEFAVYLKEFNLKSEWDNALPRVYQFNHFCVHAILFEPDVTDEEILWCFEWALAQTHLNYLEDDLHCKKGTSAKVVNQDIEYFSRKAFYQGAKQIPVENQTVFMKTEMAKCVSAEAKINYLQNVDFTKVKTVETYSVKK